MIDLSLIEYPDAPSAKPTAFTDAQSFETYYTKSALNYGPGKNNECCMLVYLHTSGQNSFELMDRYYGCLRTAWGNWKIDGVYRSHNGIYEWRHNKDIYMKDS